MKIHIISASPRLNSGFSTVAINVSKGLQKLGHNISFSGLQTADSSEWSQNIEILPTQVGHIDDITQCMITIDRILPDIVLNIFQADYGFNEFPKLFKKCLWYVPVEGRNISQIMANDLLSVKMNGGEIVAQTLYGKKEIQLALGGLSIPYIYHGFDNRIFAPIDVNNGKDITYCYYRTNVGRGTSDPEVLCSQGCFTCNLSGKEQSYCKYYKREHISILRFTNGKWKEENIPVTELPNVSKNKLIFGFVGQNLGVRKRIERLIKSYYLFVKDSKQLKDRTTLHLHTKPISIEGINLIKVIQDLGIQDNIIFSYGTYRSSGWTELAMNILYNSFDVNVSASSGEGFSLPVLEGMACGLPMVAPNCSSFTELIGDENDKNRRGLLASIIDYQMLQDGSERALVDEENLAHQMKEMYSNKELYKLCSKNAIEFSSNYTWEKICNQWNDLLKTMK